MIDVRSLAAFRRFLALPGAIVTVIRHDWLDNPPPNSAWEGQDMRAKIVAPRTIAKVQNNGVKFSNGSWLYWDKTWGGRGAESFRFEGDTVTIDLSKDGSFNAVCIYRLSLAESVAA